MRLMQTACVEHDWLMRERINLKRPARLHFPCIEVDVLTFWHQRMGFQESKNSRYNRQKHGRK